MIRQSYTIDEFAELEELHLNPSHTGRVAQGWNWTLGAVTSIEDNSFEECYAFSNVTILYEVLSTGNSAFADCKWLSRVDIPSTITSIGNSAFSSIPSNCVIYVLSVSVNVYKPVSGWSSYTNYIQGE